MLSSNNYLNPEEIKALWGHKKQKEKPVRMYEKGFLFIKEKACTKRLQTIFLDILKGKKIK